jgi:hypothetical protein
VANVDRRYLAWMAAILGVAVLPLFAGFVGLGWELAQLAGLLACLGCLGLTGAPIRPRASTPATLMSLRLHSAIGWATLLAVALHVGGLVWADRTVIEYFKPSMPLYLIAGFVGSALLIVVVLGAGPRVRRLFPSHRGFQATHVILGCVLTFCVLAHVVATNRYAGGHGRRAWIVAATIGGFLLLASHRRASRGAAPVIGRFRQAVFGRHSRLVLTVLIVLAVGLVGLLPGGSRAALRESVVARASSLPLDFPHTKHVQVNCLTCHHNFADGRGFESCVLCHKSGRADLKMGVEARFHGFCTDCHRHPASLVGHGPVSGCATCHRQPDAGP